MRSPLIIGTRGSDLALWQANFIKNRLAENGIASELKIIRTQGDIMHDLSPDKMEGKGFFTKEIEDALLRNETDIAVHSFKDLPTATPDGLIIAAVPAREEANELLLISKNAYDKRKTLGLKKGACVGTSSARRKSQLLAFRNDLVLKDIRGNVPTRIQKLRDGNFDAILIASAGVERLEIDISDFHCERPEPSEFIPAPAQGALAVQIRSGDHELKKLLSFLDHQQDRLLAELERKILNLFQGGCQTPVGVHAAYDDETEIFSVRVAKAGSWDKLPVTVYSESKNAGQLALRAVEKINSVKPCRVFITRNGREGSYLRNVLTGNGFELEEKALIEILPVPYRSLPECEWIFFSSKHAVKFFFEQNPEISQQRFGCVGKVTSDTLRKYGRRADFIGAGTDTRLTGKQFASLVGAGKVLFPQAKGSMKSIQQQFVKKGQVIDLVVYETIKRNDGKMPEADIIVFTSPSNVEAWFEKFEFKKSRKAVAMGDATAHTLRERGVHPAAMADRFDDTGLARAVFGASSDAGN